MNHFEIATCFACQEPLNTLDEWWNYSYGNSVQPVLLCGLECLLSFSGKTFTKFNDSADGTRRKSYLPTPVIPTYETDRLEVWKELRQALDTARQHFYFSQRPKPVAQSPRQQKVGLKKRAPLDWMTACRQLRQISRSTSSSQDVIFT